MRVSSGVRYAFASSRRRSLPGRDRGSALQRHQKSESSGWLENRHAIFERAQPCQSSLLPGRAGPGSRERRSLVVPSERSSLVARGTEGPAHSRKRSASLERLRRGTPRFARRQRVQPAGSCRPRPTHGPGRGGLIRCRHGFVTTREVTAKPWCRRRRRFSTWELRYCRPRRVAASSSRRVSSPRRRSAPAVQYPSWSLSDS